MNKLFRLMDFDKLEDSRRMMDKLKLFLVKEDISIKDAMRQMDKSGEKILFVADADNIILGVVTDGDVRRWILKGRSLSEDIAKAMNRNPIFIEEGYSKEKAENLMVSQRIECVPVVDENKRIVSAIRWTDLFGNKFRKHQALNVPVVIMAGGKGNSLNPINKVLPKPLVPVGDKPMMELIIDRFVEYECKEFYLSVNYKSNMIKAYFSDFEHSYKISYIQEERPLGTAGSLHLLKDKIKSTFYLSNCDTLIEADYADILRFHRKSENKITLVGSVKHYPIPYGICEIEEGGSLKGFKEKPEYGFLVSTGMYVLEPEVLKDIPKNKLYNMTDLINNYVEKGERMGVYPISEKSWFDMGQWKELQETIKSFGVE